MDSGFYWPFSGGPRRKDIPATLTTSRTVVQASQSTLFPSLQDLPGHHQNNKLLLLCGNLHSCPESPMRGCSPINSVALGSHRTEPVKQTESSGFYRVHVGHRQKMAEGVNDMLVFFDSLHPNWTLTPIQSIWMFSISNTLVHLATLHRRRSVPKMC